MQTLIRDWNPGDAETIARLNEQWGYPSLPEEVLFRLQTLSSLTYHEVFVAEIDNGVAGWVYVYKHYSMGADAFAEIGGLVVDEKLRKKGIGKMLVEKAGIWAAQNGLKRLLVRTNIKREEANAFYEKCGLKLVKKQHVFEIGL